MAFRYSRPHRGLLSLCIYVAVLAAFVTSVPGAAAQIPERNAKSVANTPAVPIETQAKFAVILDFASGDVLYAKRATTPTAPASMSKLMTAAIVFDHLKTGALTLDTPFTVSAKAWRWKGSKMWVLVDTQIRVEDLLRGLIIQSGNDAAIVLAENIAGSEDAFAALMNRKAREWGLTDSQFANATGWPDPGQRMSMLDLARLARKIIRDYSDYYALFGERNFTWSKIEQENRNPLLRTFDGADGLKTGHTDEAGYGVVGSAVRDGVRRIVVVQGLETASARLRTARRMMTRAFDDFAKRDYFTANESLADALVFKGRAQTVPLGLREDVSLLAHRKLADKARAQVIYEGPVAAPILKDQQIGYLRVSVPGQLTRDYPLFAMEAVKEVGWIGKIALGARKLLIKPAASDATGAATGAQAGAVSP
ncbi:MAG: D-alanyl-D-alanine carboxypeptidase family protein [Pseudomonadota bacterium]